ncbi:MAG TPA: hypothetical protein VL985_10755 [Stellaceae bacterium]|nr:hypothetical protein [Stellaceae bacterium]
MQQRFARIIVTTAAAVSVALVFGCSTAATDPGGRPLAVAAPYAPPPERAEIPPPAPTPNSLWQCGHWAWDGTKYVWAHGSYLQRPTPTANWMPGYWEQDPAGWIWTGGHWES